MDHTMDPMTPPKEKRPRIKEGWLRALLFCVSLLLTIFLISLPADQVMNWLHGHQALSRIPVSSTALDQSGSLWFTILAGLVCSLLLVFLFCRWIDCRKWIDLGLNSDGHLADGITGALLALAILGSGALILFFTRHLEWSDLIFTPTDLFLELGILMLVAFSEEIVFRGYILGNLMESLPKWPALATSALLFTLFHAANPGFSVASLVNIFLAGVLAGINYIYTRNLWFAIAFHLSWNFIQGPLLGFSVSGLPFGSLLQPVLKGDQSITGGTFGFEGSIVCGALIFTSILVLYGAYEKKFAAPPLSPDAA
jgi:membrane protease YdiL (CAAX protease family)